MKPIEIGAVLSDDNLKIIKQFSSKIKVEKKIYFKKKWFDSS